MRYTRRRRTVHRDRKLEVTRAKSCVTKKERLSRRAASSGEQNGRRLLAVSWSSARHTSRKTGLGRFWSRLESVRARTPAGKRLESSKGSRGRWYPIVRVRAGGGADRSWDRNITSDITWRNRQPPALAAYGMASILSAKRALRSLPGTSVKQKNGVVAVATRCNSTKTTPETTPETLNWSQYLAIRRQRHKWETVRVTMLAIGCHIECSYRSHPFQRRWLDFKELSRTSRHRRSISQRPSWYFPSPPEPFLLNPTDCRVLIP